MGYIKDIDEFLKLKNLFLNPISTRPPGFHLVLSDISKDFDKSAYSYSWTAQTELHRAVLLEIFKYIPKEFADYISNGKSLNSLNGQEINTAILKYEEYGHLDQLFERLIYNIVDSNVPNEEDKFIYPSENTFVVKKFITKNETEELRLVREVEPHPFEDINIKQVKRCHHCFTLFFAKKNDSRIKYCTNKCRNAAHQEEFQTKKQMEENKSVNL